MRDQQKRRNEKEGNLPKYPPTFSFFYPYLYPLQNLNKNKFVIKTLTFLTCFYRHLMYINFHNFVCQISYIHMQMTSYTIGSTN